MNASAPRFEFYEKVRVVCADNSLNREVGAVLGRSQDEKGGWHYAVAFCSEDKCVMFAEEDLAATGEFTERQEFYDGSSLRVFVDEHGRGRLSGSQDHSTSDGNAGDPPDRE